MPPPCRVLVLYLMPFFSGQLQVLSGMEKLPFDMASSSFDDQYDGCEARMEEKVGELQRAEFAKDADYRRVWEMAAAEWNKRKASISVPKGLKPDYAIALLAYTQKKESLYIRVNKAVREAGESEENLKNFHFKSFHFLLTRALQVLRTNCSETYRGIRDIQFTVVPSKMARFGSFTSSAVKKEVAERFGDDTFFTIKSCQGASITKHSFYPEEEEVLIPPYELFQVADSTETSSGKIRICLISAGVSSNYNCVYIKGAGVSHLQVNVRVPFLLWGFLLVAGALEAQAFSEHGACFLKNLLLGMKWNSNGK